MDLHKLTYFLITGASKGIGKQMAIECAKKFKDGSVIVLMARSKEGLEATKEEILQNNKNLIVKTYSVDLSDVNSNTLQKDLDDSTHNRNLDEFENAFIIHNVGSIGDVSKAAKDFKNMDYWINYYKLNVFSVAILNNLFIEKFAKNKKVVVNITSKAAIEVFKSFALYCSGKAAREMYFRVLAEEEPDIVVLNYSPGPVDTDMTIYVQNSSSDASLREYFEGSRKNKTILTVAQTTSKFLKVLEESKYKSGDHVDYYD